MHPTVCRLDQTFTLSDRLAKPVGSQAETEPMVAGGLIVIVVE